MLFCKEEQISLCNALEPLESSGSKVFMSGPIVGKYVWIYFRQVWVDLL